MNGPPWPRNGVRGQRTTSHRSLLLASRHASEKHLVGASSTRSPSLRLHRLRPCRALGIIGGGKAALGGIPTGAGSVCRPHGRARKQSVVGSARNSAAQRGLATNWVARLPLGSREGVSGYGSFPQKRVQASTGTQGDRDYNLQNEQERKQVFIEQTRGRAVNDYLKSRRTPPLGKYEVKMGCDIPAILEQGINSDCPAR